MALTADQQAAERRRGAELVQEWFAEFTCADIGEVEAVDIIKGADALTALLRPFTSQPKADGAGKYAYEVSELSGALLDVAVAKAEGHALDEFGYNLSIRDNNGAPSEWAPSTNWGQGGPIIQREMMTLHPRPQCAPLWAAQVFVGPAAALPVYGYGETPLIAAMRCYVVSKLGAEVDL